MMQRNTLNNGWRLTAIDGLDAVPSELKAALTGEGVAATTPGCVHTDLLAAGLTADPYVGFNDRDQEWIGLVDWCYQLRFNVTPEQLEADRVDLVCEGLDSIAEIAVNGNSVGTSESMFIPLRLELKPALRTGENELSITLRSPLKYAEAMRDRLGALPHGGASIDLQLPYNMIRKMACNFGWDWGPALVSSGIWRPVYLETWNSARIEGLRLLVTHADESRADVTMCLQIPGATTSPHQLQLRYELLGPDGEPVLADQRDAGPGESVEDTFSVSKPHRWWPVGHGDQPLYTFRIQLCDAQGEILDTAEKRIGLRTVELVTRDEKNHPTFHIRVNGKRIYCRGANWIPNDTFPHRVTYDDYRRRITQARDVNMNMLRVWGGGIYETEDFYDICDELGIMVWQDLLTACAAYPEEPPFPDLFEQELRHHVTRLCGHPSLVLWNGGNECIWGAFSWGPKWEAARKDPDRGWGLKYWLDLFPKIIKELDPARPYWANSPYSGSLDEHPNNESHGNCHHWDVWNGHGEYSNYLKHDPLFASEFGFHGPPAWPTLDRMLPADQRAWDTPAMHNHNRQDGGQLRADRLINTQFAEPDNFDDWFYLAQINQVRALTLGCEWFRSRSPRNSGALYWQLNDCWPVASWSSVDGDGRPKPLWFATRRFFRDRLVTIQPCDPIEDTEKPGPLAVCFHNDHDEVWAGKCAVRLLQLDGVELKRFEQDVSIEPRGSFHLTVPDSMQSNPDALLVAELGDARSFWFFSRDKNMTYPRPAFESQLERRGDELELTITAVSLLRDLTVYADRLDPDATIDDQAVTLLPGETRTFRIRTDKDLSQESLTTRPVMQVANHYGRR